MNSKNTMGEIRHPCKKPTDKVNVCLFQSFTSHHHQGHMEVGPQSHPKDWWSRASNPLPLVYKAVDLFTTT